MKDAERPDGGSAFPITHKTTAPFGVETKFSGAPGMSLRDYFAAKAMQGLIVNTTPDLSEGVRANHISDAAYALADAMLKARQA